MRPALWHPPVTPSAAEQAIIKRIRRAKLFVFLREHRHELFNDTFQEELATRLCCKNLLPHAVGVEDKPLASLRQSFQTGWR